MYLYNQKYHFDFYEFGIIGKLLDNAKISFFSKVDKMYLLLYCVTYDHFISPTYTMKSDVSHTLISGHRDGGWSNFTVIGIP